MQFTNLWIDFTHSFFTQDYHLGKLPSDFSTKFMFFSPEHLTELNYKFLLVTHDWETIELLESVVRRRTALTNQLGELSTASSDWTLLKLGYELANHHYNNVASATANISYALQHTIPNVKFFYPEPFIASPSYMHSDITFLHILQYWYWLWFLFIFLIIFFSTTFLGTLRWCTLRIRPRRETRGVSRSKCGDLITACVPVSWAISIIVYESADAIDLNDGFGTGELVVGVRAYQWGWEYYYPKSIDLNYNVRPSYSSFIGNSLNYSMSSGQNLDSNNLWRLYQNKIDDKVITPAHLLLLPVDSGKTANFLNYSGLGSNTLRGAGAFAKVSNFSKTYTTNLIYSPSSLTSKYNSMHNLYFDDNKFLNTVNYGLTRQHNLISPSATTTGFATLLDSHSTDRFMNYTLDYTVSKPTTSTYILEEPSHAPTSAIMSSESVFHVNKILGDESFFRNHPTLLKIVFAPNVLNLTNSDSDKTALNFPVLKLLNTGLNKIHSYNWSRFNDKAFLENRSLYTVNMTLWTKPIINNKVSMSSGVNTKTLPSDQSVRQYTNLSPRISHYNLANGVNPIVSNLISTGKTNPSTTFLDNYLSNQSGYADLATTEKIMGNRAFMPGNHPAVSSMSNTTNSFENDSMVSKSILFSNQKNLIVEQVKEKKLEIVDLLKGPRELSPAGFNSSYWSFFWQNSNPNLRLNPIINFNQLNSLLYLPPFTAYSEYDFRNDQSLDMFEDAFWENSLSSYTYYDYLSISNVFNKAVTESQKKIGLSDFFYAPMNLPAPVNNPAGLKKALESVGTVYANPVYFDDALQHPSFLKTHSFYQTPLLSDLNESDESYSSRKNFLQTDSSLLSTLTGTNSYAVFPQSYLSIFNNFRGDYEDFTWWSSRIPQSSSPIPAINMSFSDDLDYLNIFVNLDSYQTTFNSRRFSGLINLRSTARNLIVNSNAFQKVARARFDENRANTNSLQLSYLGQKQPFVTDSKVPYLSMLKKNQESFYSTPLYHSTTLHNVNLSESLLNFLNTPVYDFPFLLAQTSDVTRHAWIDWFSQWKYIEVQPSSVSRFSTLGVPYLRKPFDFNTSSGEKFQDTEAYFTRISRSRRNYLPNWLYSPYLYNRFYVWNKLGKISDTLLEVSMSAAFQKNILQQMSWYWTKDSYRDCSQTGLTYSFSGDNVYNKSTFRPFTSIQSYYTTINHLTDILSRRELLYRQYFESKNAVIRLPSELTANPFNPLINDLKSYFLFVDPTSYVGEDSRSTIYPSLSYFKLLYIKELPSYFTSLLHKLPVNTGVIDKYLLFYFGGSNLNTIGRNEELYRNPYRPLRKGVSSMLRLHATGAIAMPIEMRLQVLASSRDVIHSWSIPSAGVKIDCVPGYTSHKIMVFLLTGIYWGQCQEICGRYHHWMPIVAYFMKRDLFFLWCTHFVFNPSSASQWDISDRQFNDYLRLVSYDKSSWLTEVAHRL